MVPRPFNDRDRTSVDRLAEQVVESGPAPASRGDRSAIDTALVSMREQAHQDLRAAAASLRELIDELDAVPAWHFRRRVRLRAQVAEGRSRFMTALTRLEVSHEIPLDSERRRAEREAWRRRASQDELHARLPNHPDPDYARRFTSES